VYQLRDSNNILILGFRNMRCKGQICFTWCIKQIARRFYWR